MPPRWVSGRGYDRRDPTARAGRVSPLTRLAPSGPRRAQAQELLANRFGPIPEKAHAVTSRVTSWAFWFSSVVLGNGERGFASKKYREITNVSFCSMQQKAHARVWLAARQAHEVYKNTAGLTLK